MTGTRTISTALAAALLFSGAACSSDPAPPTAPSQATTVTTGASLAPSSMATSPDPGPTTPITPQRVPTGDATKRPAGGLVQPGQVNGRDATAIAIAVVSATYRHDTAIDHSPSDAQRRARPWLAPALAALLAGGPAAAPGAEWNTWARHRAYTTTTALDATEYGAPPDTTTRADRTITVTVRPTGRDRWRGPAQRHAVFVTMTRTSATAPWRVTQMQVQE